MFNIVLCSWRQSLALYFYSFQVVLTWGHVHMNFPSEEVIFLFVPTAHECANNQEYHTRLFHHCLLHKLERCMSSCFCINFLLSGASSLVTSPKEDIVISKLRWTVSSWCREAQLLKAYRYNIKTESCWNCYAWRKIISLVQDYWYKLKTISHKCSIWWVASSYQQTPQSQLQCHWWKLSWWSGFGHLTSRSGAPERRSPPRLHCRCQAQWKRWCSCSRGCRCPLPWSRSGERTAGTDETLQGREHVDMHPSLILQSFGIQWE